MAKPSGHRTPDEVESWLAHQGYALEHATADVFRQAGFEASLGRTYVDPIGGKIRDIDVVAEVLLTSSPAHIYVVAECKGATIGAWVVRESRLPWNEDLWTPIATPSLAAKLDASKHLFAAYLPAGEPHGPTSFSIVEAVDNGDRDAAYLALSQAASAARGWIARATTPSMVLPLVVVDAPLLTLRYDTIGRAELAEVKQRRVLWPDPGPGPSSRTAIDVVTRAELGSHAAQLRALLEAIAEKLLENGLARLSV